MTNKKARIIAFYLPQFHPIPENDKWWGKDFTEWTNVSKAKPLFPGHYQPRVPADLGYYDLRDPKIREKQAEMAQYAGIEGFAYWHYWFAGKQLLERPLGEVLKSGSPTLPFCIAWANETWSGIWHGKPGKILIEQTYPGVEDYKNHFFANLEAFLDSRYIKVNGKLLFFIYRPLKIPAIKQFFDCWNELAIKNGLPGFHFVGYAANKKQIDEVLQLGLDGVNSFWLNDACISENSAKYVWNKISEVYLRGHLRFPVWNFEKLVSSLSSPIDAQENIYPTILSGWDNSPRSGKRGRIIVNYTPIDFEKHVMNTLDIVKNKNIETNIVFLKSWNEWAESNYVEPDLKYGWEYLNVLKKKFA
jgi:hypothetical protein